MLGVATFRVSPELRLALGAVTTLVFLVVGLSLLSTHKTLGALALALAVYRGGWVAYGLMLWISPDDEEEDEA